jgi:anaerobic magnesium-protoporphyrin IX monomethyl ester cyclase
MNPISQVNTPDHSSDRLSLIPHSEQKTFCRPEDIILIINPSLWYQCMYPTGILCLSSYLELNGFPNIILDSAICSKRIPIHERKKALLERVTELKPRVIGFSSTHMEFDEVVQLNSAIRSCDPRIITIVGGSQPTYRTMDFLNNGFDFVCVGEGEKTLLSFVKEALNGTREWQTISGLAWKQNGRVISNPPRALMTEAELQFDLIAAYDKIDARYFDFNVEIIRGLPLIGALLLTTRGCPYNCSFCGCNLIFGKNLRHRPIEGIEKELKYLVGKRQVEGIWILDDTFTVNKKHAASVAGVLSRYDILWGCQSRVDTLSENFVRELSKHGCVQMDFGVESGSQRILDEIINKKTKIDQVVRSFDLARKNGIRTLANFMIGLPTETRADLEDTKRLANQIHADIYVFSIALPLPGTRLYELVGEEIQPKDYSALNWNGSPLTEKLNKSSIENLVHEYRNLKLRYLLKSIFKFIFSLKGAIFLLCRKHRLKRIRAAASFIRRIVLRC